MPDYLTQVASVTGLAKQTPGSAFFKKQSIVAGWIDGYFVLINPARPFRRGKERRAIEIVVRAGGVKEPDQVRSALEPGMGWESDLTVDARSASIRWHYWFARPSPEKIRDRVRDLLAALNPVADRCTKCDQCGAEEPLDFCYFGPELELVWCSRCRQQWLDKEAAHLNRYAKLPVHLGRAILLTSIVAIGGAEIIARIWYKSPSLSPYFWSTAVLGLVIGLISAMGAGKVTRGVKALAYSATTLSVWIALARSSMLSSPYHPSPSMNAGLLLLTVLVALWCAWLPLLLTGWGMFMWRLFIEWTEIYREKSRAEDKAPPAGR